MTASVAANPLAIAPHSQTAKFFKLVNDNAALHCLRHRLWLEAWVENDAYVIYRLETKPDGLGIRKTQVATCESEMFISVKFMLFERQLLEEGYIRESETEKGGNSRGGIGLTPRRSPALRFRRALGLIPHAIS